MSRHHNERDTTTRRRHRATIARSRPDCYLCGEPIDYTITDQHHPRFYTVDHIVPLSKGGADTLANKAAAHRECNSRKRSRLVSPVVKRSGSLPPL